MFARILRWLNSTRISDPIERQLAVQLQLLLMLLVAVGLAAVISSLLIVGSNPAGWLDAVLNFIIALMFAGLLVMLRRGRFKLVAGLLILLLLVVTSLNLFSNGILGNPGSVLLLCLTVVMAGLLLPRRVLIGVSVVSFLLLLSVALLELSGRLPPTTNTPEQIIDGVVFLYGMITLVLTVLLDQVGGTLRRSLNESVLNGAALDAERERLQVTLGSIGDAVISTDAQGNIAFLNPVAEKLTRWSNAEAMGQPLERVFNIVNETTREPVESPVTKVLREGVVIGLANHTVLIARDGRETPIDDSGAPIRDAAGNIIGVVLVFRNISDRKEHERYVQRLQDITSSLSEAITPDDAARVVADSANRLLGAYQTALMVLNPETEHLEFLIKDDVVLGLREKFPSIPLDYASPISDAVRTNAPVWINSLTAFVERYPHLEDVIRSTTSTRSTAAIPLVANREVIGGLAVSFASEHEMNSDEREFLLALGREAALALERANLYLAEREARQRAEEANALKLKFLAMISHELRTPLTSIKGFISTLLTEDVVWDAPTQREFMEIINQESDNLANLVEQLLDLSRLEAGTLAIKLQRQPLQAAIDIAMPRMEIACVEHRLDVDIPDDLPDAVFDAQRIAQVLSNLVHNACKYSPKNTTVRISAQAQPDAIQINVSDEGIGIPKEDRESVFEAFQQAGNRPATETKGAGLGLAISRALVEAQHGHIRIQDREGGGTTISFTVPRG